MLQLHRDEVEAFYVGFLSKLRLASMHVDTSSSQNIAKYPRPLSYPIHPHFISINYGPPDSHGKQLHFSSLSGGISEEVSGL